MCGRSAVRIGQLGVYVAVRSAMDEPQDRGQPHRWHIEEREYARQIERRGRVHAYEQLTAVTSALVVIDMVPFFVTQNSYCRGIVPNIARLAVALRAAGGLVVWVLRAVLSQASASPIEFFGAAAADVLKPIGRLRTAARSAVVGV